MIDHPGTTMLRLEPSQRIALSDTVRDLANLVAAALVLGQFVGERPFSWLLMLTGSAVWISLVVFGLVVERSRR
jgi:hypothetical protein